MEASTRVKLQLRPLQEATMELVRAAFREGKRKVVLYGPTGFGKTEMGIAFMHATSQKFKRSSIIVDRTVLVNQTSLRLDKYGIDHGVHQADHWRRRGGERIQVVSAQTAEKRGTFPEAHMVLVDECHGKRKLTIEYIKNNPEVYFIGLSASPFTEGLAEIYDCVVSATTTSELVSQGWLAPLRVFVAKQIDMKDAAKGRDGEWKSSEASKRGRQITGDVVMEWERKCIEIFGEARKTIVFASDVEHGRNLANAFGEAGYNFQAVSYKDEPGFTSDVIADFSRPDTELNGIIATDILTKGFDVPDVMVGISARPFTKSFSSHVQQMGRVMRPYEGKEYALWLDHSGNYLRFQEDWDDVYENGVKVLSSEKEKAHKELTAKELEHATCPRCKAAMPRLADFCVNCGFQRPHRNKVQEVPGELVELGTKIKATRAAKQEFFGQLVTIAREKGYQHGWIQHKYREKFGVWPVGMALMPLPATEEVRKFLTHLQIRDRHTRTKVA